MPAATTAIIAILALAAAGVAVAQKSSTPASAEPPLAIIWRLPLQVLGDRPQAPDLLAGDAVVVVARADAGLSAFAAKDGAALWSSPVVATVPPVLASETVVVAARGVLRGIATATGDGVWQAELDAGPSLLFAVADRVGAVIAGEMRVWDAAGTLVWRAKLGGTPVTPVVSRRGVLYAGLDEPSLVAVDAASGAIRWRVPLPAKPESLAATDDRLYLGASDGALYSLRVTGDAGPAWRYPLVRPIGQPLTDDRFVYFALLDNSVRAFDRNGGSQRWSRVVPFAPSRPMTGPLDVGTSVAVVLTSGQVVELSRAAGTVLTPPAKSSGAAPEAALRLQAAAASSAAQRIYTVTIAKDYTSTLTAWGRSPERR